MKGLALALASATTAVVPQISVSNTMNTATPFRAAPFVQGFRTEFRANESRPDRVPGEFSVSRIISNSSGFLSVGDFAAVTKGKGLAMEDVMLGAALFLQANQSHMDHDIQALVSSNFEAYWD
jgi:hypothetical protein